jgi:hypothetical protein
VKQARTVFLPAILDVVHLLTVIPQALLLNQLDYLLMDIVVVKD